MGSSVPSTHPIEEVTERVDAAGKRIYVSNHDNNEVTSSGDEEEPENPTNPATTSEQAVMLNLQEFMEAMEATPVPTINKARGKGVVATNEAPIPVQSSHTNKRPLPKPKPRAGRSPATTGKRGKSNR